MFIIFPFVNDTISIYLFIIMCVLRMNYFCKHVSLCISQRHVLCRFANKVTQCFSNTLVHLKVYWKYYFSLWIEIFVWKTEVDLVVYELSNIIVKFYIRKLNTNCKERALKMFMNTMTVIKETNRASRFFYKKISP